LAWDVPVMSLCRAPPGLEDDIDDAQTCAGMESLYLWAEDLAEGHIL
jgi:hypothetical protein